MFPISACHLSMRRSKHFRLRYLLQMLVAHTLFVTALCSPAAPFLPRALHVIASLAFETAISTAESSLRPRTRFAATSGRPGRRYSRVSVRTATLHRVFDHFRGVPWPETSSQSGTTIILHFLTGIHWRNSRASLSLLCAVQMRPILPRPLC